MRKLIAMCVALGATLTASLAFAEEDASSPDGVIDWTTALVWMGHNPMITFGVIAGVWGLLKWIKRSASGNVSSPLGVTDVTSIDRASRSNRPIE